MNTLRIFVIPSGGNKVQLIEHVLKSAPALLWTTDQDVRSTEVIPLKYLDINFHAIDENGGQIPINQDGTYNFKIAEFLGDTGTGDFDIIVYGRPDD